MTPLTVYKLSTVNWGEDDHRGENEQKIGKC